MAGPLDERERGYEAKWAQCLVGQWAAEAMKLPAAEVSPHVQAVIAAGLNGKSGGRDFVFEKIRGDLAARTMGCPDAAIRSKMKALFDEAAKTVLGNR